MTDAQPGSFERDAGESLVELGALLSGPSNPDPAALLRLAQQVRESATSAGADTIAGVAGRLEDAAATFASRAVEWSDELRDLALQTVQDLEVLVRAFHRWGPDEEARVLAAVERWNERANAAVEVEPIPVETLFHDDEGPHVLAGPALADPDAVVGVETLLYRGEAALRAALRLRDRAGALAGNAGDPALRDLLDELFDLVALGAADPRDAG